MSLPNSVLEEFATHAARAKQAERARRETVQPVNLVDDASETVAAADPTEALGKRQPTDKFAGCANLRTLRTLLKMIDDRGYERCAAARRCALALSVSHVTFGARCVKKGRIIKECSTPPSSAARRALCTMGSSKFPGAR